MTLTRRDRAAMRLAYECLRGNGTFDQAREALWLGGDGAYAIWTWSPTATDDEPPERIKRARLALLLRAMLREDDLRTTFSRCCRADLCVYSPKLSGLDHDRRVDGRWQFRCPECMEWRDWSRDATIRHYPLWEQAPRHEVAT